MRYAEALNLFQQIQKRSKNRAFVIAFCGVFSSGKTSIINNLLNNEFKLPVGINPVTKVITRVRYGTELGVYYNCGKLHKIFNTCDAIPILKGDIPLPDNCNEIIVTMPSEILKNGVEFLDTPGFEDEMGGELERISRDAVLQSNLAVLCTSALKFGDMFEKEYIEELSESIQNFCLVVNRIDGLNTKKDYFDVVNRAEQLLEGKISPILKRMSATPAFFTSADGNYPTLNGLDDYLAEIAKDKHVKEQLNISSNNSIARYQMKRLIEKINYEILLQEEEISKLNSKNQKLLKEKQDYLQTGKNEFQNKINKEKGSISVKLNSAKEDIERGLTELEKNKEHTKFVVESKKLIQNYIHFIAEDFDAFVESIGCGLNPNMQYNLKCFTDKFDFPAPKGERGKRNLTNLAVISTFGLLDSIISHNWRLPSAEDMYYTEYKDYHIPAIKAVNEELIPGIAELINAGFEQIEQMVRYECPRVGCLEGTISEYTRILNDWQLLKSAAINYLEQ